MAFWSNITGGVFDDDESTTPPPETPQERAARMRAVGQANAADQYASGLRNAAPVEPRQAPTVADPRMVKSARVGDAPTIQAGSVPLVHADRVVSAYDQAQSDQARQQQQGYIDRLNGTINGTAPSAAVGAMHDASNRNVAGAYALAGSKGGYGGAALRAAQRQAGAAGQQLVSQTGQERARETATAMGLQGQAIEGMRGQDLTLAQERGRQGLEAGMANQRSNLTAAQGNQSVGLDIQRMNQAAHLQTQLTQAGFDQQTIMHMSDQELQTHLANAGFQLSQEQIDDLRSQNQVENVLKAQGQSIGAAGSVADRELQLRKIRYDYIAGVKARNAQHRAAVTGMMGQGVAGMSALKGLGSNGNYELGNGTKGQTGWDTSVDGQTGYDSPHIHNGTDNNPGGDYTIQPGDSVGGGQTGPDDFGPGGGGVYA